MAKARKSQRVTASFRVDKALLEEFSTFVRDQAGAPLYLDRAGLLESAMRHELDRMRGQLLLGADHELAALGNGFSHRLTTK
jgi:hypothetical protein